MNAYSGSDLDDFGNEFIFFSLGGWGGGKAVERRYLEVNTENTLFHKSQSKVITVCPGSQKAGCSSFTKCQLMKGTMNFTNTHHFANSVLKCCNHGPEPLQFYKHIC